MSKTKRGYSKRLKEQAFRLYRQFEGNSRRVSREMDGRPSHVTITGWAEQEDWDGKIEESQNAVRKMLNIGKDPLVQRLAKDDVFVVEVLSLLQGIALKEIKRKKSRIRPRNANELIKWLSFIAGEYRLRVGGKDRAGEPQKSLSKNTFREVLAAELGGDEAAQEAAGGLIVGLRQEIRRLRKKQLRESTRHIEDAS